MMMNRILAFKQQYGLAHVHLHASKEVQGNVRRIA